MNVRVKQKLYAAIGALIFAGGLIFMIQGASASSEPQADGMTIRLTGEGWWQVQDLDNNYANICEGEISSCDVPHAGTYQVINHTTGEKWPVDVREDSENDAPGGSSNANKSNNADENNDDDVQDDEPQTNESASAPVAEGMTIQLAGSGWWQVQDRGNDFANICEGEINSCLVPYAGSYQVINHTTGERWPVDVGEGLNNDVPGGSSNGDRLTAPTFRSVAANNDGYVSVIWAPIAGDANGVHVYRDNEKIATATSGNVYNDFEGSAGASYQLTTFNDDQESEKSQPKTAAEATRGAWGFLSIEGVSIYWTPQPDITYTISRQASGGTVRHNRGTVLARNVTNGFFKDTSPKQGASYGIEGRRSDGTILPVETVEVSYNVKFNIAEPLAFELTIGWRGAGEYRVASLTNGFECVKNPEPRNRYCEVPAPGDYKVTHVASQKSWTITAKHSPIVPKTTVINGTKVWAADTNYGTVLVLNNAAELEATTGINVTPAGGVTVNSSFRTGFSAQAAPPPAENVIYSVKKPGKTIEQTSKDVSIVTVWKKNPDGSPGPVAGYYAQGKFITIEEMATRDDAMIDAAIAISDLNPGKKAVSQFIKHLIRKVAQKQTTEQVADGNDNSDGDSGDSCFGSNCHNGVELNEHTDPDGDGLSVFGDDDNDNDGIPTHLDDDDLDPNVGCSSCGGGNTGGTPGSNSGSGESTGGETGSSTDDTGSDDTGGGSDTNTDGGAGGLTGGGQQQQHSTSSTGDTGNSGATTSGGTSSSTGAGGGSNSGFHMT